MLQRLLVQFSIELSTGKYQMVSTSTQNKFLTSWLVKNFQQINAFQLTLLLLEKLMKDLRISELV